MSEAESMVTFEIWSKKDTHSFMKALYLGLCIIFNTSFKGFSEMGEIMYDF